MSVNTKMTAIADEIRTLSGTTGTMGLDAMATNVGNANSEIVDQNEVLEQIKSALEGKSVGSEDSEGPNLEICTVELTISKSSMDDAAASHIIYITIENDKIVSRCINVETDLTYSPANESRVITGSENRLVGSIQCIVGTAISLFDFRCKEPTITTSSNISTIYDEYYDYGGKAYAVTVISGTTGSITASY